MVRMVCGCVERFRGLVEERRVRAFIEGGLCLKPGRPNALVPGHPFV